MGAGDYAHLVREVFERSRQAYADLKGLDAQSVLGRLREAREAFIDGVRERWVNGVIGASEYAAYLGILYASHELLGENVPMWTVPIYLAAGASLTGDGLSRIAANMSLLQLNALHGGNDPISKILIKMSLLKLPALEGGDLEAVVDDES